MKPLGKNQCSLNVCLGYHGNIPENIAGIYFNWSQVNSKLLFHTPISFNSVLIFSSRDVGTIRA